MTENVPTDPAVVLPVEEREIFGAFVALMSTMVWYLHFPLNNL